MTICTCYIYIARYLCIIIKHNIDDYLFISFEMAICNSHENTDILLALRLHNLSLLFLSIEVIY